MTFPNNGLYILGPLSHIGCTLAQALDDQCAVRINLYELASPESTLSTGDYLNFELERVRNKADFSALQKALLDFQPNLQHCTAAPRLHGPMVDIYERLLHLAKHQKPAKNRPAADPLSTGDLPWLSTDVRGVRNFVSALETAAEAYSDFVRVQAAYVDVQHQQRFLLESYGEMETKYIDNAGPAGQLKKLMSVINQDEIRHSTFRIKHARAIQKIVPTLDKLFALRNSLEELCASREVNEFAFDFHMTNWMALSVLSADLRRRDHQARQMARRDVREFQPAKVSPAVEEYRQERATQRDHFLASGDNTLQDIFGSRA